MRLLPGTLVLLSLGLSFSGAGLAEQDLAARVALAKSAAPASISDKATIVVDGKVVAEGSNGWTCMPDTMPGDGAAMCNDAEWMRMMQAVGSKADFVANGVGISYMLHGDIGAGVSNATPYHPDPKSADDYTETGPHLMIIVPRELLKGITTDPASGGPYVMWGETPYAHIMVPLGAPH
ncbi:MAG: hypothetical protein OEW92_00565 [Gammaproteobacteria bacterium]|jgi:hypothetical protein|nr:hypothetical protein [Gammaproteobacteria bacterium]MDH5170879.1 hypothetical protein [Gammaproteobacteria bacterium]